MPLDAETDPHVHPQSAMQKILYVEDDAALARLLQKRMERTGLSVDTVDTAEKALELIAAKTYDLLLVDYNLPGMNGLEMLERLGALPQSPPAVILTVGGDERIALEALERGAADYAVKDVNQTYLDLLPAIMQAAYTKERLLRENARQREELTQARDRAEQASEAKSRFLATMSHEIRTPMNVVTGLATILAKSPLNDDQKKIVDTLRTNADLLLKLINDLLDISRIEDGRVELETIRYEPGAILNDIRLMFQSDLQTKGLKLELVDDTNGAVLLGDRTRLQQVLMNLVSNALKFTDVGEIILTASAEPADTGPDDDDVMLSLSVRDTGIGIASDKLPLIFDKFTQADETITRRFGGSGLGLSIARSLVEMMGGTIHVESHLGEGSAFHVQLLQKRGAAVAPPEAAPVVRPLPTSLSTLLNGRMLHKPVAGENGKPCVLIVEDYAPNIMVLTLMLEELGYDTVAAASGTDAIDIIKAANGPHYAILMDVQMQGMDGLETTRWIRDLEAAGRGYRNNIIGVTAHALAGDRERCLQAGMDDYISKPVLPDILALKLSQLR